MLEEDLQKLVLEIQSRRCEGQGVEVKKALKDCPTSLYDTLSSFSNQNAGGIIVFGLDEDEDFAVKGVYDAQDLQHKVTEQCREMEPQVRALFTTTEIGGKVVVSAEIPPQDVFRRPVYYKGKGRLGGAFVRVGDADERMTEFEIYSYEAYHRHVKSDRRIIEEADISLWNRERVAEYVRLIKQDRPNLCGAVADADIPEKMGLVRGGHPSITGLMVFSTCPQVYLPQLCITAIVVPGMEKGGVDVDGVRFVNNRKITGAIPEMLDEAERFVLQNTKTAVSFDKAGRRTDRTEYPMRAVREAILNALIHRDYSEYSETSPIRLEIYSDRLEIANKGDIYGAVPVSALGHVEIGRRNAFLVDTLETIHQTENRNSGIMTMRAECRARNLPEPLFCCVHGEFKVIFKNSQPADRVAFDRSKAEESIIAYCELPRSREELAGFAGLNQNYVMATWVRPLVRAGRLLRTDPQNPKSPFQRFVRARDNSCEEREMRDAD